MILKTANGKKATFLLVLVAFYFSTSAAGFSVTQVTASPNLVLVTTGTAVSIASTLKGDSTGTATTTSLVGTGKSTGAALRVVNPASGLFTGTQVTTSVTPLTFLVTASTADTYNFRVTSTYTGGSASSPVATIQFVDPSSLTVSGTASSTSILVGNTLTYTATLLNPSASTVSTSYSLSYSSSSFAVIGGDSTSGTITLPRGGTYIFSWTIRGAGTVSNSPINFGLGSNAAAFYKSVSVTSGSAGGSGSTSGGTATSTPPVSIGTPIGPSTGGVSTSGNKAGASSAIITKILGPSASVMGSFAKDFTSFTLKFTAATQGGFNGDISYHLPLNYADYASGKITFEPQPKSVKPGSITAVWNIHINTGDTFIAKILVNKKLDPSIIKDFTLPMLSARGESPITGNVIRVPGLQNQPAGKSESASGNALIFPFATIASLCLILLFVGLLYFRYSSRR